MVAPAMRPAPAPRARPRPQRGVLRVAIAFALLLSSLSLVIWRQSRALELLRDMDQLRSAAAVVESERAVLVRHAQVLESRPRVVSAAAERLGLRVPEGDEVVILPLRLAPEAVHGL